MTRSINRNSTAMFVLAAAMLASPATTFAQDMGATEGDGEIVVTARRQSERLIEVPASVSVLTEAALENTGVQVAADFVQLTPGVTIVTGNVEASDTQINIRGLNGARDAESNVALVVDGVLKTNTSSLNQDQGAITQIEVLKGPQGAIYGRNAAAGAIVITTKKPGDTLEGNVKASYANNDTITASALISAPLGEGLGVVINGDYARGDGFYRNRFFPSAENAAVYPNNTRKAASVDNFERWNVNGRLVWEGETTEVDAKVRYGEVTSGAISFNAIFQVPALSGLNPDFNIDANDHRFLFTNNVDPKNRQKTFESSLRLTADLGAVELVAFAAYNDIKNYFYGDGTSGTFAFFNEETNCAASSTALAGYPVQSPFGIGGGAFLPPYSPTTCDGTQYQRRAQTDYSAEIRLIGEAGAINWQVGAYYLHIDRDVCLNLGVDTGQGVVARCYTTDARNPTEQLADDSFDTDVYAVFGSVDARLAEKFKAGLALRYDIEERSVSNNIPLAARTRWVGNVLTGNPNGTATTPANYFLNPGLDPVYNPSGTFPDRSRTFKQFQPKVTLSYEASRNFTVYGNWGIGFKSGGFNNSGSQAIVDGFFNDVFGAGISIFDSYEKERSSSFEAGLKWQDAGGRASFELAGYWTDVTDMQFFEFFVGPFGLLRVVSNIDKVRIKGIEAAGSVTVMDGWTVFASGNVVDSKIRQNGARPYTVGNKSPYTADYTINLGSQLDMPITDSYNMLLRADYRITGPTWFHTVQNNNVPTIFPGLTGNFTNAQRDAYGILNLRGGVTSDRWSLIAFANNVFSKNYLAEVIPAPEFGGAFVTPGNQELYGVEVTLRF